MMFQELFSRIRYEVELWAEDEARLGPIAVQSKSGAVIDLIFPGVSLITTLVGPAVAERESSVRVTTIGLSTVLASIVLVSVSPSVVCEAVCEAARATPAAKTSITPITPRKTIVRLISSPFLAGTT